MAGTFHLGLQRRALQPLVRFIRSGDGEFWLGKGKNTIESKGLAYQKQQRDMEKEEEERATICNCQKSTEDIALVALLKACAKQKDLSKGSKLHADILKRGLLKNIYVGSTLINLYAKCGALAKAQQVFDELPIRNTVCWNALMTGYAQNGCGEEALNCFERMQRENLSPDAVTFSCIVKACGSIGAAQKGSEIHAVIVREGLLEKDVLLGNALVDMYAKCGALAKAQQVFDELPCRNSVTWNVLITGYVQHEHGEEALNHFEQMQLEGLSPDAVTFTCIVKACGNAGTVEKGKEIYSEIVKERLLEKHVLLGNAVVDMFAKFGELAQAQHVFDKLPTRNIVCWNALIAGYAQHGHGEEALNCFRRMLSVGLSPNTVTFTVVLNACKNSGLLDEAQMYFATMSTRHGIIPTLEHHTCMIDLFGRAGHFDNVLAAIKKMPSLNYLPVWSALLGACRKWGNVKLGRWAFQHAVQLDEKSPAAYLCMSGIYAAAGMQDDADKVEVMRMKNVSIVEAARIRWWTDVNGNVFYVGDS